jgi:hypothetical protein
MSHDIVREVAGRNSTPPFSFLDQEGTASGSRRGSARSMLLVTSRPQTWGCCTHDFASPGEMPRDAMR